jgi:hypothetical protein
MNDDQWNEASSNDEDDDSISLGSAVQNMRERRRTRRVLVQVCLDSETNRGDKVLRGTSRPIEAGITFELVCSEDITWKRLALAAAQRYGQSSITC